MLGPNSGTLVEPTTAHEVSVRLKERQAKLSRNQLFAELSSWSSGDEDDDAGDGEPVAQNGE